MPMQSTQHSHCVWVHTESVCRGYRVSECVCVYIESIECEGGDIEGGGGGGGAKCS